MPQEQTTNPIKTIMRQITIIVPVFNALHETASCVGSILSHTRLSFDCQLLVADDCSSRNMEPLYQTMDSRYIHITRQPKNIGYVANINQAIRLCPGRDIVLLNSDTLVTENWLKKLRQAAYSRPNIATVTPVSNNAGVFSVPWEGPVPLGLGRERMAEIIDSCGKGIAIEVPTGNGFCMYVRRDAIDSIGMFDEENFPKGYGEENDFCLRAIDAGYVNLMVLDAYVFHHGHKSFGPEREQLSRQALNTLQAFYPDYEKQTSIFSTDPVLIKFREDVRDRLNQISMLRSVHAPASCHTNIGALFEIEEHQSSATRFLDMGKNITSYLSKQFSKGDDVPPPPFPPLASVLDKMRNADHSSILEKCFVDDNKGGASWEKTMSGVKAATRSGKSALCLAWGKYWPLVIVTLYTPGSRMVACVENIQEALDAFQPCEIEINNLEGWPENTDADLEAWAGKNRARLLDCQNVR